MPRYPPQIQTVCLFSPIDSARMKTLVDTAANETSYRLERSVNGGSYLLWVVLGANTAGYTDTAVAAGSTYAYRVVAVG